MKNSRMKWSTYLHCFQSFGQFKILKFNVQSPESRFQRPELSIQSPATRVQGPESSLQSPASKTCFQSPRIPVYAFRKARGGRGLIMSYFTKILKGKKRVSILRYYFIVSQIFNTKKHHKQSPELLIYCVIIDRSMYSCIINIL